MYHPAELIQDIQSKLDRMARNYRTLLETIKKLETDNKALTTSLEEAIKQQESLKQKLDAINKESGKDTKGLDLWKNETRKEIKGIMKEMEKCLPQVESLLDK